MLKDNIPLITGIKSEFATFVIIDDKNKENKDDINKPGTKTGDDSNTFILLMLMILSLAGAGAVLATRKSV